MFDPRIHHRRNIRLRGYDYSQAGAYFVTICTQNRACLFGVVIDGEMRLNAAGRVVERSWRWLANQYNHVELDAWVVMPNHLHGIIVIVDDGRRGGSRTAPTNTDTSQGGSRTAPTKPLGRLIGAFKTVCTKQINQCRQTPGIRIWQRNYYERIIRSEAALARIREYIANNPLQWTRDRNNPANIKQREP